MAEYSAYVRTVYWSARPESEKVAVLKGFRDNSALCKSSLTLARARADAQYGEDVRNGKLGGFGGYGGHPRDRSPRDRPFLRKRAAPVQEGRGTLSPGAGSGGEQSGREGPRAPIQPRRLEGERNTQDPCLGTSVRCKACLKMDTRASRGSALYPGEIRYPKWTLRYRS